MLRMPRSYATQAMRSARFAVTRLDGYAGLRNCAIVGFACADRCGASASENDTAITAVRQRINDLETGRYAITLIIYPVRFHSREPAWASVPAATILR